MAWYPSQTYSYFETTVPDLVQTTQQFGESLWLGLDGNTENGAAHDPAHLAALVASSEHIADELWALYPGKIAGWYIPFEVSQDTVGTYDTSYQKGYYFGQLAHYLHTHDGKLPVMESPTWAPNIVRGQTAQYFADELLPMLQVWRQMTAGDPQGDIINEQDGGGTSGITPTQIAAGFAELQKNTSANGFRVLDDVELFAGNGAPASSSSLEARMKAAAPYVESLSGYQFPDNLDPYVRNGVNATAWQNYYAYCRG